MSKSILSFVVVWVAVGAGVASGQTPAPVMPKSGDLQISRECLNDAAAGDGKLAGATSSPGLAGYNPKCDHQWALQGGTSIYTVNEQYAQRKYEMLKDAGKMDEYYKDGTCLKGFRETPTAAPRDESFDECKERLKRDALNARVEARERILQYNKARTELSTESGGTIGHGETGKDPKTSVLTDLYHMSKPKDAKGKPASVITTDGATEIDVGPSEAGVERSAPLEKVGTAEIKDPALQKSMGLEDTGGKIEVSAEGTDDVDAKLKAKLKNKKSDFALEKFQKDRRKKESAAKVRKPGALIVPVAGPSMRAFRGVMEDINSSVKSKSSRDNPQGIEAPGAKPVHVFRSIESGGKDPKSRGLDEGIEDSVRDDPPLNH